MINSCHFPYHFHNITPTEPRLGFVLLSLLNGDVFLKLFLLFLVQVVNIITNKCVRTIGKNDSLRILSLALYQGLFFQVGRVCGCMGVCLCICVCPCLLCLCVYVCMWLCVCVLVGVHVSMYVCVPVPMCFCACILVLTVPATSTTA